jgi:hypothetical protein
MKKRKLALLGFAALAGVALASCGGGSGDNTGSNTNTGGSDSGTGSQTGGTAEVKDAYYSGKGNESGVCVWDPISLASAKAVYDTLQVEGKGVGGDLDTWLVYSQYYGIAYNGTDADAIKRPNPITNTNYSDGDILPAWQDFGTKLGVSFRKARQYGAKDDKNYETFESNYSSGVNIDDNGNKTDLFYNTTANLNKAGEKGYLVDLKPYIEGGQMPALKKFLDDNPAVKKEITHEDKIFFSPYMDGYQAIERNFMMDTAQVEKLLDSEIPAGLGQLAAGKNGAEKGLRTSAKAQPFMGKDGKNYDADLKIKIVADGAAKEVTVKQTDNIITLQNKLLDAGTTGKALIDQFKTYARAAYGDIIDTYYDGKISKMFTSVGACYNADDLVALLRIFKANPDVLFNSSTDYDAVVPVFPRGQADNRVENILNFGATLYGVQGRGSEFEHLFFGADGKIHDFDTAQQSFDMLEKLSLLYSEGLIQENFWSGTQGTGGYDAFFAHKSEAVKQLNDDGSVKKVTFSSTFGLLEYDYIATQSAANDYDDVSYIGTKSTARKAAACGYDFSEVSVTGIKAILSPLTYVATNDFKYEQSLDTREGKTIVRFYEENRAVKNTSWGVVASSDNKASAIAAIDLMFTKEGWETQNFGPSSDDVSQSYWTYGNAYGLTNTPVVRSQILTAVSESGKDFWNFSRSTIGSTQGIGHYRPASLDWQATNAATRQSYQDLTTAASLGVQMTTRSVSSADDFSWHASMLMSVFTAVNPTLATEYEAVTNFWAQKSKASKSGDTLGWVAIIANGANYTGQVLEVSSEPVTYANVKTLRSKKNQVYLKHMAEKLGMIPDEAEKQ